MDYIKRQSAEYVEIKTLTFRLFRVIKIMLRLMRSLIGSLSFLANTAGRKLDGHVIVHWNVKK
jgi:hypothetical protein